MTPKRALLKQINTKITHASRAVQTGKETALLDALATLQNFKRRVQAAGDEEIPALQQIWHETTEL